MKPKTIVLGVSGGIAAYKACDLVRLLVKEGYRVHCVLTEHASQFVSPLTLATLSGQPVLTGNFEASLSGTMEHIRLAEEADLILVAPATANVLGKIAHGIADDLVTTVVLAAQGPVAICPAMNVYMWENPATRENVKTLEERGLEIIGPASGSLACGYEGLGRMEEPEAIVDHVKLLLTRTDLFAGKKLVVTAGPTREFFDPVRCLTNPSSGKMGYALARAARQHGARVVLISGPTDLQAPFGVDLVRVTTAEEMLQAVKGHFADADFFISAAAVSDWKPKRVSLQKEKKEKAEAVVELLPNPDILAFLGKEKKGQVLVGFAAETQDLEANAEKKLREKNLDLIVGNLVSGVNLPLGGSRAFGSDENEVTLFFRSGEKKPYVRMSKLRAAHIILEAAARIPRSS